MKKVMLSVAVLLLSANLALAGAWVENEQGQGQFDGAFGSPNGQIGGAAGGQYQLGAGASSFGDNANDYQFNAQGMNDSAAYGAPGNGTFQEWNTLQVQEAGGTSGAGGVYGYGQVQGQAGGAAMVNNGAGTYAEAGSAYVGGSAGAAGALGFGAGAGATQTQGFEGHYQNQTSGPNSYINQEGHQFAGTGTNVGAENAGLAGGAAWTTQSGSTAAQNNGAGTAMSGSGHAQGEATAVAGSIGNAGAEAGAYATQNHSYEQGNQSSDGTSFQYEQGSVSTTVQAYESN